MACGLREGEALALRWDAVDGARRSLSVHATLTRIAGEWRHGKPKSKKSRRKVALPILALDALADQRNRQAAWQLRAGARWMDSGLVFTSMWGGPLHASGVRTDLHALQAKQGLRRVRFHDLRHSMASILAVAGHSMKETQAILGHSNYAITANLYTHVFEPQKRAAADSIDRILRRPKGA
jgi:integrase